MTKLNISPIQLKISKIKLKFMDSRLLSAADRARYGFLIHAGGLIRKISRNSQKPATNRKQVSNPGDPPLSHKQSPIRYKDQIFYYVDKTLGRMYCGAILLDGKGGHKCPKTLEYGGPVNIWINTTSTTSTARVRQKITVTMKERPHQRPALREFIKQYQDKLLKNCIRAY